MGDAPENDRELTSWKDIAAFFDVSVRTAQKWEEERGLPVRRFPGGGRGRVSAYENELLQWKRSNAQLKQIENGSTESQIGPKVRDQAGVITPHLFNTARVTTQMKRITRGKAIACAIVVLLLAGAGLIYLFLRTSPPARWVVDNNALIVSDARGRELWRKTFALPLSEQNYRETAPHRSAAWQGDLDGDGRVETLFPVTTASAEDPAFLICFSDKGIEKWRFSTDKVVRSQKPEEFLPVYRLNNFLVAPMGKDHKNKILAVFLQYRFYPTQIALLSAGGQLLREYWHSGHIGNGNNLRVADLNGDGLPEIYLGGVSNGYKQATLVVLDPDSFEGAGLEENSDFQLLDLGRGKELARILFPRSCINKVTHDYNNAHTLNIVSNQLEVHVTEREPASDGSAFNVFYTLTPDMKLASFNTGDYFQVIHRQLEAAGKLDHPFSKKEAAGFGNLRYLTPPPSIHPIDKN